MNRITEDTVVQRRDQLLANDLSASETVMLDVNRGTYFGMRDVGKAIWDEIAQPVRVATICDNLMERYEVDAATCKQEVVAFLTELHDEGLIDAEGFGPNP